jgi:RNA polymerase sigma-70 factor (ECF subfamily)
MHQIVEQDTEAIGQLYDRYSSILFSLIKEIAGDKDTAEKVLEDVFVMIWNRIEEFDFRTGNVFTWLATLAKNKAVDVVKRREEDYEGPEYSEEFERDHILPQLSPEIKILELNKVLHSRVTLQQSVISLTDAQKYVLLLMISGGSSEVEIAKKLSIPTPTVRIKLQAALNSLHERMKEVIAND